MKVLDLSNPKDAKEFLMSIKVDGRRVTEFHLASGKIITVNEMTDSQAIHYATDLYFDLYKGKDGGGIIDINIDRGLI